MRPLVSILIPCYNSGRWLPETRKSAINQTWQYKEIIIVDDGSSDDSVSIAKHFQSGEVKLIQQENSGAGVARNRALSEAQGDFIQYLDADDLLSQSKIEEQVKLLQANAADKLAISSFAYFYDGEPLSTSQVVAGWPVVDSDDPLEWLIDLWGGNDRAEMVPLHAWLTPRAITEAAGLWDAHPSPDDDGEYFARVVLASKGIRRVEAGRCYYRKHRSGGSWSGGRSELLQWGALRSLDLKAQHILKLTNAPVAKRALARQYMDRAFVAYPNYPKITDAALNRIDELGGTDYMPSPGGWRGQLLQKVLGWKKARKVGTNYNQYASRFKRVFGHPHSK